MKLYLPTIISHPDDFTFFHRILPFAIRNFPTPEDIRIKRTNEIADDEINAVFLQCAKEAVGSVITEDEISESTSFHLYEIILETNDDFQPLIEHVWLNEGLASLFNNLGRFHVGFFFYLISEDTFKLLNYGETTEGFFDDSDDEKTISEYEPLQMKAKYFKEKWYGI